jgi:hypothetical protein
MAKKIGNISALEFALSHILDEPQREDEFSAEDAYVEARKKNPKLTLSGVRQKLMRMEQNGALKKRTKRHNGTTINLYSKA